MGSSYMFREEVVHNGLNKYRVVGASSRYELNQKVAALEAQWDEQWRKKCAVERQKMAREEKLRNIEEALQYSEEATKEAERIQTKLDLILVNSLMKMPFNIESMKDFSPYSEVEPIKPLEPVYPDAPQSDDIKYNPKKPFITKLSKKKLEAFNNQNTDLFKQDWEQWESKRKLIQDGYEHSISDYKKRLAEWKFAKDEFIKRQCEYNSEIDEFHKQYNDGKKDAIEKFNTMVLNSLEIDLDFDRQEELQYNADSKMLILDMFLPIIENIPRLRKVTYIKSKSEFKEMVHTDAYIKKKYDSIIYQIVLQILNAIFKNDKEHNYIQSIVLNGKNSTIDKATGKRIEPYVLSINVEKSDFCELNLSNIDPKAWFRKAKGISAASLADVTPIPPIVQMNREDSRFVEGYDVINSIDNSINLAAIDWKDFENLVRELFEQEFSTNGGEVKITQASRDGGVDAVAFDPDPIRGGKIVIQAKRYTNVVGVSAVRDLYGTVVNEGAIKGILVTTSYYGSDAFKFAKDKPIALMNGANLLQMLEKHGHKMRIDLEEAKRILKS